MTLTVGSLFSGIGGLDLGLERAGMSVAWQSEIDPYACRVLAKHWPTTPNLGDITTIDWKKVPRVDLICGGFPCQPVSEAGSQRAQADDRWLWPEFRRALVYLRPEFAIVENVTGLLAANRGRAMGEVVGDLADLGYDAEWSVVSACSMGAPHTRDRVFLVAHDDSRGQQAGGPGGSGDGEAVARRGAGGEHLHPASLTGGSTRGSDRWAVEPGVGRMADGLSPELDRGRLRALGNAVVPQVAEYIGRRIMEVAA